MRIGIGYDVHKLVENRKLILGGIEIPSEYGLLGHSDADVLVHSIMDAMLGALALGDIGKHFPDTSDEFKDIDSCELLQRVYKLIKNEGYVIGNIDTVVAILQQKTKIHNIEVPEDALAYIATHIQSNIRELEGALTKVIASAKITGRPVTLESATHALERTLGVKPKEPLTIETIIEKVAKNYDVTATDIYSKNRSKRIAWPRQIAMYLSRELTDLSLIKIAARFEKDHSTVIYGIDKIKKEMEKDKEFTREIQTLREEIAE